MKNKKALALKTIITLVISALCIVILVYVGYTLSKSFFDENAQEKALRNLDQIIDKIEGLEDGEVGRHIIVNPENWAIMVKENEIATCLFIDMSGPYVKDRFGACSVKGISKKVGFRLDTEIFCKYAIESCFNLENLPIEIFFKRTGDKVVLTTKDGIQGNEVLGNLLEYKKDKDSKTLQEFVTNYIDVAEEKGDRTLLEKELINVVGTYVSELDSSDLFDVSKEKFFWIFGIYKVEEGDMKMFFKKSSSNYKQERLISTNDFDFEHNGYTYRIGLTFWEGEYLGQAAGLDFTGP